MFRSISLCVLFLVLAKITSAQEPPQNFYDSAKYFDFTELWRADSVTDLEIVDDSLIQVPEKFPFPEPLGFIGDNYQRFYIHFSLVVRSKKNPFQYFVKGKTKVKDNIRSFAGKITIDSALLCNEDHVPNIFRQGYLVCSYRFYEDKKCSSCGVLSGQLRTGFCFYKGCIFYDNIDGVADGYSNNQSRGEWKSYDGKTARKCNWGDYRIPDSKKLDIGAGEFSVADQYVRFGWENYCIAYNGQAKDSLAQLEAIKIEDKEWWK